MSRNGAHRLGGGHPVRRVLFFGKNMSRTRCTGALVDALQQNGLEVKWLNLATIRRWRGVEGAHRRARKVFASFRPDVVFVFCRDLPLDLLREFKSDARIVLWVEDVLADHELAGYMSHADLVCMSALRHPEHWHARGVENITFLFSGFSPRFHSPSKPKKPVRDIAFIGGPGASGQRARLISKISERFDTEVFGVRRAWEHWADLYGNVRVRGPLRNSGYRRVCATSRIVLGLNEVNDLPLYFSNRTFLTLACAGFHLTHHVPGLETVFENGEHLAWYRSEEECIEKLGHYLEQDEERARIARAGHELVMRDHQYYHRVSRILDILTGAESAAAHSRIAAANGTTSISRTALSLASGGR